MSKIIVRANSKERGLVDLTEVFMRGSLKSDIGQVADCFEVEFGYAEDTNPDFPIIPLDLGDTLIVNEAESGVEVFRGVIVDEERDGRAFRKFIAYDPAWYMTKSKMVIQFRDVLASVAIGRVVKNYGVPIQYIAPMTTKINEIYINKTGIEIIEDILSKVEKEKVITYHYEMRQGGFYLDALKAVPVEVKFYLSENTRESLGLSIDDVVEKVSRKRSIADMKNTIQVFFHYSKTVKDKTGKKKEIHWGDVYEASDPVNVARYGTLAEVLEEKAEKGVVIRRVSKALAMAAAQKTLEKMNRVFEDVSFEVLGDLQFRAGRGLRINEPISGISGTYLIRSCEHIFSDGVHKTKMTLGVADDVR